MFLFLFFVTLFSIFSFNLCENQTNGLSQYPWNALLNVSSDNFERVFLPNYIDFEQNVLENLKISFECKKSLHYSVTKLKLRRAWAVKLFNSWASFPPIGIAHGTLTDFGDYDQCLSVVSPSIRSQYCLADIAIPMPRPMPERHNYFHKSKILPENREQFLKSQLKNDKILPFLVNESFYRELENVASVFYYANIQIGICMPDKCLTSDTKELLNKNLNNFGLSIDKLTCETKTDKLRLDYVQQLAVLFFVSIFLLIISSAIYDQFYVLEDGQYSEFLLCFSPLTNIRKLISAKSSEDELACVHGMRVLTICWIIAGHSVNWNGLNSFRHTFSIRDKLTEMVPQPLYRGIISVDTFFFLSGLLTSYIIVKYTKRSYENFNSIAFLLLRYLRLTPQLVAFILATILLPKMFDGPIWKRYIAITDQCYTNWWINLIYLQNLINVGNICGLHTWYLAADMQLHWLSLIPVIFLLKNRKTGIAISVLLILFTIALSVGTIYLKQLPPGSVITSNNDFFDENAMPKDYLKFVYQPWTHAYVFFVGFLLGDYITANKDKLNNIKLSKSTTYLLWCTVCATLLFSIYSTVPWLHGRPYEPVWSAILFPLNLLTWTAGIGLTIWLCVTGNSGFVGRLLSLPVFKPLSRMTYSVYLTHVWVVWVIAGTRRDLIDLQTYSMLYLFAAEIFLSFAVGFMFTILFDTPVINLLELVRVRLENRSKYAQNEPQKQNILLTN